MIVVTKPPAACVSRDVSILRPGQPLEEALRNVVAGTACFVVLISANSAADDSGVPREVAWRLAGLTRYLLCRDDRMFAAAWARRLARQRLGSTPMRWPVGNTSPLSRPH
jgi:hypothetical protein